MKKNMMRFAVYMTALFLIMLAINIEKGDQFYVRFMDVTDVKPVKEVEAFVTEDGISITNENNIVYRGKITTGPNLALEKGKYAFAIKYKTDNPNNFFVIAEPLKMKEDGTVGEIYASQKLQTNENRSRVEFALEQDINNLEIHIFYQGGTLEFYGVDMHIMDGFQDTLLLSIGFFVIAGLICFYLCFKKEECVLGKYGDEIIVLTLVVGVSMLPYMNDFLIYGHDLQFHLARIEGTYRALTYGEFPVRINPIQSNGYGYATPVMYPQLFIYFPAVLRMMGMSLLNSYKLLLLFVNILTAGIAYFSFRRLFHSRYAGLLGTAFYTLCLYRLTNLYVREALGEALAMALLPLVIYGMYEIICGEDKKWPWAALGFTLVLQSHILSTFLYGSFTFIFCVLFIKKFIVEKRRILSLCKAAGLTILVNLWFFVPFLDYNRLSMQLVNQETMYLSDRTTYLSQVFAMFVPMGQGNIAGGTTTNEMPLTVGWLLLLGAVLFLLLGRDKEKREENVTYQRLYQAGKICLNVAVITLIMSSWLFPWNLVASIKGGGTLILSIQFFWRLLSLVSIALCFVSVAACSILINCYKANGKWVSYAGVVLAIVGCTYLVDSTLQLGGYENAAEAANTSISDYLYYYEEGDDKALKLRGETITVSEGTTAVFNQYQKEGTKLSFHANVTKCGKEPYIEVPLYAYPGYQAFWNDTRLPVVVGESGTVRLLIPNEGGEGEIRVFFEEPFYWKVGNVITLITVLAIGGYGLFVIVWKKKVIKVKTD